MQPIDKKELNKKLTIPFIISLCCTILLLASLFLPYTSATPDYAERLSKHPDIVVSGEMTAGELIDVSMYEYAQIYLSIGEEHVIYTGIVAVIGLTALLAFIFAATKKCIGIIIPTVIGSMVFSLLNFDFKDRGIGPDELYDWGISYYLFFIAALGAIAGAIWMLVVKIQTKKQMRAAQMPYPPYPPQN